MMQRYACSSSCNSCPTVELIIERKLMLPLRNHMESTPDTKEVIRGSEIQQILHPTRSHIKKGGTTCGLCDGEVILTPSPTEPG